MLECDRFDHSQPERDQQRHADPQSCGHCDADGGRDALGNGNGDGDA
jgi:hypothetical protein